MENKSKNDYIIDAIRQRFQSAHPMINASNYRDSSMFMEEMEGYICRAKDVLKDFKIELDENKENFVFSQGEKRFELSIRYIKDIISIDENDCGHYYFNLTMEHVRDKVINSSSDEDIESLDYTQPEK